MTIIIGSRGAAQEGAAQDAGPTVVLPPVTVTGERVERTVQETPSSVVVVTGDELAESAGRDSVEEVLERIPNITTSGTSSAGPTIRGVNTTGVLSGADAFLGGSRPRSTITVDGRPLSFNEFIFGATSVYDLERIEVFRGPQTTAQGVNSIAGATYVTTADPTFEPEASALALVGNFYQRQLAAAASGPIVADQLAARISVDRREEQSFIDFDRTEGYGADPNEFEQHAVRAKLLWEPEAMPNLSTKLTFSRSSGEAPQVELVREPFSDEQSNGLNDPVFRSIANTGIHDLRYSLTDWLTLNNRFSTTFVDVTRFAPEGEGPATIDGTDYINETTLNFTGFGDRLSGLLGTYLRRTHNDEVIDLSDFLGIGEFDDRSTSVGIFGETTYKITSRFDVTLGLRYQRDSQDRQGSLGPFEVDYDESFDALLPKFAAGYDLSDNVRVGAVASRGFNPGGTTISFETGNQYTFQDETVWNYELFARSRFLEDRLGLNANLFYSDFTDFQRSTFTGFSPAGDPEFQIDNADKARTYGLELEAEALVTDRLRLTGGLGLLDTELVKFSASADEDIEGSEFAEAPDVTAIAGAAYEIVDGLTMAGQVRYSDSYFSDDDNLEEIDSFVVADFRLSYRYRAVEAFAFVDNAFDEFYQLSRFSIGDDASATLGQPREYGVGLRLTF